MNPNADSKGDFPVALAGVKRNISRICGMNSVHKASFKPSKYFLRAIFMTPTIRSAWPFAYGYPGDVLFLLTPYSFSRSSTAPSYSVPLSALMMFGVPNRERRLVSIHLAISSEDLVLKVPISTHLVNASTATTKLQWSLGSGGRPGMVSMLHTWNGRYPFSVGCRCWWA